MELSISSLSEYRSAATDDSLGEDGQQSLLVPGGTTCCSNGACSSCTCSAAQQAEAA